MRLVRILVPYEDQFAVTSVLEDNDVDFVLYGAETPANRCLVEFPLPVGAVEDVLDQIRDRGVDVGEYTVVSSLETATTRNLADLEAAYVEESSEMRHISHAELRVEAQDHKPDVWTFVLLATLSAMVASAGLLLDSAVVIVGAMVLAPFLSTIVSGSVGLVIDDRPLIVESLLHQPMGLATAILGGGVAAFAFRWLDIVPEELYLRSFEQITNFSTPNALVGTIAVIAGVAVALTVAADIASAFAGIAVAAAIVPSAAAIGIGIVWGAPSVAFGAFVLLLINVATVNVVSVVAFFALGYRPSALRTLQPGLTLSLRTTGTVAVALVAVLVVGFVVGTTYQYVAVERSVNQGVGDVLDRPAYDELRLVEVHTEDHLSLFGRETRVTVVVASDAAERYPSLPGRLERELSRRVDRPVGVRVRVVEYRRGSPALTTARTSPALSRSVAPRAPAA